MFSAFSYQAMKECLANKIRKDFKILRGLSLARDDINYHLYIKEVRILTGNDNNNEDHYVFYYQSVIETKQREKLLEGYLIKPENRNMDLLYPDGLPDSYILDLSNYRCITSCDRWKDLPLEWQVITHEPNSEILVWEEFEYKQDNFFDDKGNLLLNYDFANYFIRRYLRTEEYNIELKLNELNLKLVEVIDDGGEVDANCYYTLNENNKRFIISDQDDNLYQLKYQRVVDLACDEECIDYERWEDFNLETVYIVDDLEACEEKFYDYIDYDEENNNPPVLSRGEAIIVAHRVQKVEVVSYEYKLKED